MTKHKIQVAVNEILSTIDPAQFPSITVNWDDLRCTEVVALNPRTEYHWVAIIEEVNSVDLAEWIEGQLIDRAWPTVKVRTERKQCA